MENPPPKSEPNKSEREVLPAEIMRVVAGTQVTATFVQRAGMYLAAGVGALIVIVTIAILIFLFLHYPSAPATTVAPSAQADSKIALENYKELSGIAVKSAQDLFLTIVVQALLPIFTAILGYIFAKGEKQGP